MKPAKKPSSVSNREETSGDTSKSKINSFFKSVPKPLAAVTERSKSKNGECSSRQFYVQILKERLQEMNNEAGTDGKSPVDGTDDASQVDSTVDLRQVNGGSGVIEKQNDQDGNVLENDPADAVCGGSKIACSECKEWEKKYKDLKKMYVQLAVHHSELDIKHKALEKTAIGKTNNNNDDDTAPPPDDDIFTANELRFLQCMPLDKKKDSTFVLQCMQMAYKNELPVLVNKSLKGTRDWIEIVENGDDVVHPAKEALSPHKVNRIKEVFLERLLKCKITAVEYGERVKDPYINKLIASSIKNISKKQH